MRRPRWCTKQWQNVAQVLHNGELKQPRRRRQQKPHKFAYLTMKNSIFARFARALFIFWHFDDVLVLSATWNDLFCRRVDNVSIWWQIFNFVFLCPKRWFQFNSRIVRTHFSSIMTLNNWKMIAETRSYIFRWRSRFRRRRVCLSSLLSVRCPKMKNARAKRAKLMYFSVKYANLWSSCWSCHHGCLSSLFVIRYGTRFPNLKIGNKIKWNILVVIGNCWPSFWLHCWGAWLAKQTL